MNYFIVSMSTFKPLLIVFGSMGNTDEILNGFTFIPSLINIIFVLILITANGPSPLFECSLNTLTKALVMIRYLFAGTNFYCRSILILDSVTIFSISVLVDFNASNLSIWFALIFDGLISFLGKPE